MKSENLEKLKSRREYLTKWINRHKKAQEMVPIIKDNLEFAEWEMETLKNKPDEADKVPLPDLSDKLDQENEFIRQALPMIPNYDPVILWDSTAVSISSSSDVYAFAWSVGDIGTPKAVEYANTYTKKYQELQSAHNRLDKVRTLIYGLANTDTMNRFDRAHRAYIAAVTATGEHTSAANEIRNLLYGVKGNLFEKARERPREKITWEKMANRLAKGGPGSTEYQKVLEQNYSYSHLIDRLSAILKERKGGSETNLDNIWTQALDHLFIVLTLVKI